MKRCPQCGREYDNTMMFCLDDGAELLYGPASMDEPATVVLSEPGAVATGLPTDRTEIFPVGGEAEPQGNFRDASERQSHSTHRAAEPKEHREAEPQGNFGEASERQSHSAHRAAEPKEHREAEPQGNFGDASERQSHSAHRAAEPKNLRWAKPLIAAVAIVVLVAGGFFTYWYLSAGSEQINSIAVLPFENRSGTADADYLSDGLAESLIYRLTQLPGLKVSPTNAVMRYKGAQSDLTAIAKELEVDAVMSGRLTQRGDDLTVSVELTDARTNKLIWAEQYARKMSDLLATQREIANAVTQKLQLKLSGNEAGLTKQYTNDNEAYQLYLKGRFYWNKRTPEAMKTAIEQFKAASEKDPNFALAYVGLADAYLVGIYTTRGSEKEQISTGKAYAVRALEIDPSLPEAHASLGLASTYLWDWAESEKYLKRAIELNPNYPSARHWYSRRLRAEGRIDEGLEQIRRAREADELSAPITNNVAESLAEKGDLQGAINEGRRGLGIASTWFIYRTIAYAHLALGQKEEALTNARNAGEATGGGGPRARQVEGYVQAAIGNRNEAMRIAKEIEDEFVKGHADGRDVAVVYAGLGENDKVFEWLEKDYQRRSTSLVELRMEVPFAALRNDSRFNDLLRRMEWPE